MYYVEILHKDTPYIPLSIHFKDRHLLSWCDYKLIQKQKMCTDISFPSLKLLLVNRFLNLFNSEVFLVFTAVVGSLPRLISENPILTPILQCIAFSNRPAVFEAVQPASHFLHRD